MYRTFKCKVFDFILKQRKRLRNQRQAFPEILAAHALPALHVGTRWQVNFEQKKSTIQTASVSQHSSSIANVNQKRNSKMEQKQFITIQKINTIPNRRNVQRVTPKDPDSLSDENVDVRMMKRCQRKMSQTISSFHLRVPNYEKFQYHFSLKVSLHSITKSICN